MKYSIFALILIISSLIITGACDKGEQPEMVSSEQGLISQGFKDNNTYDIVCVGYPKEETSGLTRTRSAKMAAVLSAQYFAREVFTEQVDVVKLGKAVKFEYRDDYVIVHYRVTRPGLKRYAKK